MKKIIDYSFVRVTQSFADLVPLVRESIKHGWVPLGNPVLTDPYRYQFLIKYEEV